jgi:hypothetical protein
VDAEDYFIKSVQSGQPWQKAATICGIAHEKAREILDRGQIMHTTPVVDDLSRVEEFNRMLDEAEPKAVRALIEIAEHGKSDAARVAAANALLDRKRGKPQQSVQVAATVASLNLHVDWAQPTHEE